MILANFWFVIGAYPDTLYNFLGSAENGRLRGFVIFIDKAEVMKIDLIKKLQEHASSLSLLQEAAACVTQHQQKIEPSIKAFAYNADFFAVFHALHEAAREISEELETENDLPPEINQVIRASSPAFIKFVGKGFGSIAFGNVLQRNGVWHQSPTLQQALGKDSMDGKGRFLDGLACGLDLLKYLAAQVWAETERLKGAAQSPTCGNSY